MLSTQDLVEKLEAGEEILVSTQAEAVQARDLLSVNSDFWVAHTAELQDDGKFGFYLFHEPTYCILEYTEYVDESKSVLHELEERFNLEEID